ncbi:unnamed protein product, partial [Owenia fusiformis]
GNFDTQKFRISTLSTFYDGIMPGIGGSIVALGASLYNVGLEPKTVENRTSICVESHRIEVDKFRIKVVSKVKPKVKDQNYKSEVLALGVVHVKILQDELVCIVWKLLSGPNGQSRKEVTHYVSILIEDNELQTIGTLATTEDDRCGDILLCDGPICIWRDTSHLIINHLKENAFEQIKHKIFVNNAVDNLHILTHNRVSRLETIILLKVSLPKENTSADDDWPQITDSCDVTTIVMAVSFNTNSAHVQTLLHCNFIPDIYASIIVSILANIQVKKRQHSQSVTQNEYTSEIYATTNLAQLLEFIDGDVTRCIDLCYMNILRIDKFEAYGGLEYIVLANLNDEDGWDILIVQCRTFEVFKTYHSPHQAFISDFVSCGTDQLLILNDTLERNSFILTDFGAHIIDSSQVVDQVPDAKDENNTSNNLQSVIEALQSRLQATVEEVTVAKQLAVDKQQLIDDTCVAIKHMTLGTESPWTHENKSVDMVTLTGGPPPQEIITHNAYPGTNVNPLTPKAVNKWYRILGDKWIIGLEVVNTLEREIHIIGVTAHSNSKTTATMGTTESTCKIVTLSQNRQPKDFLEQTKDNTTSSTVDKPLNPNDHVTILVILDVPNFLYESSHTVDLLLHWGENIDGDMNNKFTCHLGPACISAEDIVSCKYNTEPTIGKIESLDTADEVQKTKLCLDATQITTQLEIQSQFTHPALQSILGKIGFVWSDTYLYIMETGMLKNVRVEIQARKLRLTMVVIYSNDHRQLLLLVQMLYKLLPSDCKISLSHHSNHSAIATALDAITTEANYQAIALRKMIANSNQIQSKTETFPSNDTGPIDTKNADTEIMAFENMDKGDIAANNLSSRRIFMKQRKEHTKSQSLISSEEFNSFRTNLQKLGGITDEAMCAIDK